MWPFLDGRALQTFVRVAETGGFAKAAVAVSRTQPAVSAQIRKIEVVLGGPLFERSSGRRRVALTLLGERFLAHAYELLSLNRSVITKMRAGDVAGTIRLAATEDHAAHVLPEIVAEFCRRHPHVDVRIETGMTFKMRDQIPSEYDLVLAAQRSGDRRGQFLRRESLRWIGLTEHRAHLETPLPLAIYPDSCLYRRLAEKELRKAHRSWRVAVCSPSRSTIEAMVLRGMAVTVFPASTLRPPFVALDGRGGLPPLPAIDLALYRRKVDESPAVKALADAIVEMLR
jgi:DNA-binding transcriptional LysR family regulator